MWIIAIWMNRTIRRNDYLDETFRANSWIVCQYDDPLENVTPCQSENRIVTGGAFICKNPDLIKNCRLKKTDSILVDGLEGPDAILIDQIRLTGPAMEREQARDRTCRKGIGWNKKGISFSFVAAAIGNMQ
jgi:hypothetical protein